MRVIVLSHGHPDLGAGGGERAAYSLFRRLKADPAVERAMFVARAEPEAIGHSALFGSFRGRADEVLAVPPPVDAFTFQSLNPDLLKQCVADLIRAMRPDIVHAHHFLHWGVDVLDLFRQAGVQVVLTLHEYAAICAHYGQMIKTSGRLCDAASPAECSLCFPEMTAGKFFIRQVILRSLLDSAERFVAPSEFLKLRYAEWGVPADRIAVVENVLDEDLLRRAGAPGRPGGRQPRSGRKVVFGFFGQVTPYKGLDVLVEAASSLPPEIQERIEIRVHGENTHFRDTEFGRKLDRLIEENRALVRPMGSYRNRDVLDLMSACDWVVVPSIWWENSPVVIQEAHLAGRPILCSAIGGMVEKIDPAVDRVFTAGSPGALAEALVDIVDERESGEAPVKNRLHAGSSDAAYAAHLALYRSLQVTGRRQRSPAA